MCRLNKALGPVSSRRHRRKNKALNPKPYVFLVKVDLHQVYRGVSLLQVLALDQLLVVFFLIFLRVDVPDGLFQKLQVVV